MKPYLRLPITLMGVVLFSFSITDVQAQFNCKTNDGEIIITGYDGPGGNIAIPGTLNGLPVTGIDWQAFSWRSDLISVEIPDSVTWIGSAAFYSCTELESITIPEHVDSIGGQAFVACSSLTAISVAPLNQSFSDVGGVLFNKARTTLLAFPGAKAGNYTIPGSVTSIGNDAFNYCSDLTSVTIPNSVVSVGMSAFSGCSSLTSAIIPDTVTNLGHYAFAQCYSLTSVIIGKGVSNIRDYTFIYCTNLGAVYFKGNCPIPEPYVFYGADQVTVYYLPGTLGWTDTYAERPTALWALPYPLILTTTPDFGFRSNQFGFRVSWGMSASVLVEGSTSLSSPAWLPLATNALVGGWSYFSDPHWTNYPVRFYRLRSP